MMNCSQSEADTLRHCSSNGRLVTGDKSTLEMIEKGWLFSHGPQKLAGGDHYLTLTAAGRDALSSYEKSNPAPKLKKARRSDLFLNWRIFGYGMSFKEFYHQQKSQS